MKILKVVLFAILNILVAYVITSILGIKNIILFQSLTATQYTITYEVIIVFILAIIEAFICEKIARKKDEA